MGIPKGSPVPYLVMPPKKIRASDFGLVYSSLKKLKSFQNFSSYRISQHMYRAINIGKNKN
jgi:hypothetical protein